MDEVIAALGEVIDRGAPAQQEQARILLARLRLDPTDADLTGQAGLLIDAFRHDPYLWR